MNALRHREQDTSPGVRRRPVDGGPPIGYAVVDSSRQVRYATIDPPYLKNAFEVDVISGGVE